MDKKTVNDRVIIALKYLMKLRPDLTKTMLSELLDITNSTLSHILGSRMNASVDLLTALCLRFQVSADWLLTGRGNMIDESEGAPSLSHMDMFTQLLDTVKQQAEEIGQLKAHISQLEGKGETPARSDLQSDRSEYKHLKCDFADCKS